MTSAVGKGVKYNLPGGAVHSGIKHSDPVNGQLEIAIRHSSNRYQLLILTNLIAIDAISEASGRAVKAKIHCLLTGNGDYMHKCDDPQPYSCGATIQGFAGRSLVV